MMNTSHSTAPFRIVGYAGEHDEAGARIEDAQGRHVATTWGGLQESSPAEERERYHADAKLLETAPELLTKFAVLAADDHDLSCDKTRFPRTLHKGVFETCPACHAERDLIERAGGEL